MQVKSRSYNISVCFQSRASSEIEVGEYFQKFEELFGVFRNFLDFLRVLLEVVNFGTGFWVCKHTKMGTIHEG